MIISLDICHNENDFATTELANTRSGQPTLQEHMDLCLQSLYERSVKTGNCLSAASCAGQRIEYYV